MRRAGVHSRTVDGFALGVLDELPDAYRGVGEPSDDESFGAGGLTEALRCSALLRRTGRPCPPCPASPWVILADVRVGADGTVAVDQWTHRRFVASFGSYGFFCGIQTRPQRPVLDRTTRDMVVALVAEKARPEAEAIDNPEALLALSAAKLRGAGASNALESFIGTRTVGELARTDPEKFVTAALEAGADEDAARTVVERAQLLGRIVRGGG